MTSLRENMKELYEASLKQFMGDMSFKMDPGAGMGAASFRAKLEPQPPSDEAPLDLSQPVDLSRSQSRDAAAAADHHDDVVARHERPYDDAKSETQSESTENDGNVSMTDSNPASPSGLTSLASPGASNPLIPVPPKRFRTQLSQLQVKIMKSIYQYYKTPTMCECELLGREIGLAKRVIQVWFQNARAKEKKAKMQYPNYNPEVEVLAPPEVCKLCSFKYSHKYTVQDHLFSRRHIENIKAHIKATDRDLLQDSSAMPWDKHDNPRPVNHAPAAAPRAMTGQFRHDTSTKCKRNSCWILPVCTIKCSV